MTIVAAGTAGAQIISMIFSPIITRLYGPEAFGMLGTFMAMLAVVAPIAALSYPLAIILPRYDHDALGIVRLSVRISVMAAVFVGLSLWVSGGWLTAALGLESVKDYVFIIPLTMPFIALLDITQQWLMRKKKFSILAQIAVTNSMIVNGAKVGIGWFHPVAAVLIALTAVGYILHALMLGLNARRMHPVLHKTAQPSLVVLARKYYEFPLYRAPQTLINAASQSLPILMLAAFFGPESAAYYTLGKMVMGIPSVLIGKSVGDVLYPRIVDAMHNEESISEVIIKATNSLALIGLLPFGLIIVFGPWLFSKVFGSDWFVAGEYAQWLALFFFFNFINRPSVVAVSVLGIQKGLLLYELLSTSAKVIGILIGFHYFKNDMIAVALFSIIGAIAYVLMILWILFEARIEVNYDKTS